jgi:hypothetical protein
MSTESTETRAATKIAAETFQLKPIYMNIVLLNKDEIVKNKATEKTGTSVFGRAAAYTATRLVSDSVVLGKISEKLMGAVNVAVNDMGISASIQKVFQEGSFLVIKMQIRDVDKIKLLKKAKGLEFSAAFEVLMHSLDQLGLGDTAAVDIDRKVKLNIQEGLLKKFAEIIPQKLAENGVDVDISMMSSEDQADYFFQTLSSLQCESSK